MGGEVGLVDVGEHNLVVAAEVDDDLASLLVDVRLQVLEVGEGEVGKVDHVLAGLEAEDLRLGPEQVGALRDPSQAIGRETVNHIFAGQAIRAADLGPAALVERNQLVILSYSYAGLNIVTEARALERGAIGAHIRVMNLASRSTVTGVVMADGSVSIPPRRP